MSGSEKKSPSRVLLFQRITNSYSVGGISHVLSLLSIRFVIKHDRTGYVHRYLHTKPIWSERRTQRGWKTFERLRPVHLFGRKKRKKSTDDEFFKNNNKRSSYPFHGSVDILRVLYYCVKIQKSLKYGFTWWKLWFCCSLCVILKNYLLSVLK